MEKDHRVFCPVVSYYMKSADAMVCEEVPMKKSVRWFIRIGVIMVCLIVGWLRACSLQVSSGDLYGTKARYVALGDSIAHGYGLENPSKESYVALVHQYLDSRYDTVFCSNLGVDGQTSAQLLARLSDESNQWYAKYTSTLKNADYVTISIGSNDLLHLIELNGNMAEYIERGDAEFREACETFAQNFQKIVLRIHELSPNAMILANNVYNPCYSMKVFASVAGAADEYITLLNEGLNESEKNIIVDVKSVIDDPQEHLLNVTMKGRELDPHPNREGHRKIAETVIEKIEKAENPDLTVHE